MKTLDFEPGTKYDYNNNDVFLQRRIIQGSHTLVFPSLRDEKKVVPCGIKNGLFDPSAQDKQVARSYNNAGSQDDFKREISGWAALNLSEFYNWSECLNSYRLISPASTRELLLTFAPSAQTGLGAGTMTDNQLTSHVHDGTSRYYQALLVSNAGPATTIILTSLQGP